MCIDFSSLENKFGIESFDLLISACAGFVTPSTSLLLKNDGWLVSDAHLDARMLSLDKNFTLVAVWDTADEKFVFEADILYQNTKKRGTYYTGHGSRKYCKTNSTTFV